MLHFYVPWRASVAQRLPHGSARCGRVGRAGSRLTRDTASSARRGRGSCDCECCQYKSKVLRPVTPIRVIRVAHGHGRVVCRPRITDQAHAACEMAVGGCGRGCPQVCYSATTAAVSASGEDAVAGVACVFCLASATLMMKLAKSKLAK